MSLNPFYCLLFNTSADLTKENQSDSLISLWVLAFTKEPQANKLYVHSEVSC